MHLSSELMLLFLGAAPFGVLLLPTTPHISASLKFSRQNRERKFLNLESQFNFSHGTTLKSDILNEYRDDNKLDLTSILEIFTISV